MLINDKSANQYPTKKMHRVWAHQLSRLGSSSILVSFGIGINSINIGRAPTAITADEKSINYHVFYLSLWNMNGNSLVIIKYNDRLMRNDHIKGLNSLQIMSANKGYNSTLNYWYILKCKYFALNWHSTQKWIL